MTHYLFVKLFFSLDLLGLFLCKILPNGINDGVTVWLMPCQYVTEETWERERAPSKLRVPLLFCHLILIGESRLHRNYWNSLPWPLICPPSQCEENEGLKLIGRSRLTNSIRWESLLFEQIVNGCTKSMGVGNFIINFLWRKKLLKLF